MSEEPKLIMNLGYGVQIEGDYHKNGHPKNIAKVVSTDDGNFANRVDLVQDMIDAWNTRATPTREQIMADERVQALVEAMTRISRAEWLIWQSMLPEHIAREALEKFNESP